jgi:hypothetical protein
VEKKSQMFATAIIGSTVGVKSLIRRKPRPRSLAFTRSAIARARAIEVGIVPSANHRLLASDCQKTGSAAIA